MKEKMRIGTRGSPLAVIQAETVGKLLTEAFPGLGVDYLIVRTSGDRIQDRPLAEVGGKGLFTKEIEQALFSGEIDLAVHSMKDVETFLPDGLCIAATLPREDPRDVLLSRDGKTLDDLPDGARIGTSSVRRQAQILHRRPDLAVVPFRGNVQTRMRKLDSGEADATLLAAAGLNRLNNIGIATQILAADDLLPAAAQGAIGVEIRQGDTERAEMLAAIDHPDTTLCIETERAMLAALDGSCRTPIGALAELDTTDDGVFLRGLVARPDGSELHRGDRRGARSDAIEMATELGAELRAAMGEDFFRW
jgi:hydroxymethylbilane synthase